MSERYSSTGPTPEPFSGDRFQILSLDVTSPSGERPEVSGPTIARSPGLPPTNDDEAAYHRHLTRTINARYGEAIKLWEERIVEYVGQRDEQTVDLAKHLDKLQRRGVDAERILDLAARRRPLPIDHSTAALAYRVKDLSTPRRTRRPAPSTDFSFAPKPATV